MERRPEAVPRFRYIYANDQGFLFGSANEPTSDDLSLAETGMVIITRLADLRFYGRSGKWLLIEAGGVDKGVHVPAAYLVPIATSRSR